MKIHPVGAELFCV